MINIKSDSRKIKNGDIFIALRGYNSDGHDYIKKAIANGASKLIVMDDNDYSIPYELVEDTRVYLEQYLEENYSKYLYDMDIVGITGTNGKTTTAYLLYDMLNKLNIKSGYIGTIGLYLKDGKVRDLNNTTPDLCEIYSELIDAYDNGYKKMVIEVSSEGLIHNRLFTIPFKYAIFTNLTQDHLDTHKTMENYALAKSKLFKQVRNDGFSIINIDDKYSSYFKSKNTIYYGLNDGEYRAINRVFTNHSTVFDYSCNDKIINIISPLLGKYNIYNLLAAIIVLTKMNIDINKIKEVIKDISNPPGRMDIVKYNTNSIIVDYAHTPDAITNIINTVKYIKHNNLYIVFGCTGDRDRTKRPIMMKIATDNCKYAVITMDDPHCEDPMHIIDDMTKENSSTNYKIIVDRKIAVQKGIDLLDKNDILLVLGKGHEKFIVMCDKKIPYNDKENIINYIETKGDE